MYIYSFNYLYFSSFIIFHTTLTYFIYLKKKTRIYNYEKFIIVYCLLWRIYDYIYWLIYRWTRCCQLLALFRMTLNLIVGEIQNSLLDRRSQKYITGVSRRKTHGIGNVSKMSGTKGVFLLADATTVHSARVRVYFEWGLRDRSRILRGLLNGPPKPRQVGAICCF